MEEEVNVCCFQRSGGAEQRIRKKLYNSKCPEVDPAFFSFFSNFDLNRVSKVSNKEIVIYLAPHVSAGIKTASILHDFRHVRSTEWADKAETLYYLFTYQDLKLYQLESNAANSLKISEPFFAVRPMSETRIDHHHHHRPLNYAQLIEAGLDREKQLTRFNASIDLPEINEAKYLDDFSDQLYARWKKKLLIVSFTRLLKRGNWQRKKTFSECYFATLALIVPSTGSSKTVSKCLGSKARKRTREDDDNDNDDDDDDEILVMCLWNKNQVYLLQSEFASQLVDRHFDTTGLKERRAHRLNFFGSRKLSEEHRQEAKKIWSEKRLERARQKKNQAQGRANDGNSKKKETKKLCKCKICRSKQFDENMAPFGPEQLCTTEYSLSNCLRMLGAWDLKTSQDVDLMCRLSIASMDIESKTVDVDLGSPHLNLGSGQASLYSEVDSAKLEGHVRKAQHPIMIAHIDYKTSVEKQEKKILTVENDSPEACYKMMRQYWNYVLECQRLAQEEKLRLALPYYKLAASYRKVFFETVNRWFSATKLEFQNKSQDLKRQQQPKRKKEEEEEEEPDLLLVQKEFEHDILTALAEKFEYNSLRIAAAWKATLPGKLEQALDRLVDAYEIFSFYG